MNIDILQFEAQNARVTKTLQQQGANSSLFALYLAMQIDDSNLHSACLHTLFKDENAYASMYQEPIENTDHLQKRLYSELRDYKRQDQYFGAIATCKDPSAQLHFLNSLMPQALHHSSEEIVLPENLIENLPYASQMQYKERKSESFSEPNNEVVDMPEFDGFFEEVERARRFSEQV